MSMSLVGSSLIARKIFEDQSTYKDKEKRGGGEKKSNRDQKKLENAVILLLESNKEESPMRVECDDISR